MFLTHTGNTVTSTRVAQSERMKTLPLMFGRGFMSVESAIYASMDRLSSDYNGGYWDFFTLSSGGFFMAPRCESLHITVAGNHFEAEMRAESAGIVACLFAYNALACRSRSPAMVDHYDALRDFALDQPDGSLIARAID